MAKKKRRVSNISISGKITLMYGGIFAIAIMIVSVIVMVCAYLFYRDLSRNELNETAEIVYNYIKEGNTIDKDTLEEINPNKYVDVKVTLVSHTTQKDMFNPLDRPLEPKRRINPSIIRSLRFGFDERLVEYNGKMYLIQVTRKYDRDQRILEIFGVIFIAVNIIGWIGAFWVGHYISKKMLKPITNMISLASEISIDDLSRRIDITGPDDEIAKLANTFNQMIERLEISFKKQTQFISDASHELRTPISVIQGYANLIARWGKDDKEILQESIDSIKAETEHMGLLVKKMLFLANDEKNNKKMIKGKMNLNDALLEICKEALVMNLEHRIEIVEETQGVIYGDYDLIKQMFWIFIENSMKYARNGRAHIIIYIYSIADECFVKIMDNGMGIKEEDIPYIFERFYRGDKSRSKEVPGTGLGLSIASCIMKQHGLWAEVSSDFGEGTTFIIRGFKKLDQE